MYMHMYLHTYVLYICVMYIRMHVHVYIHTHMFYVEGFSVLTMYVRIYVLYVCSIPLLEVVCSGPFICSQWHKC
jgi:hypothetical protein